MDFLEKRMATKADIEVSVANLKVWLLAGIFSAAGLIVAAIALF